MSRDIVKFLIETASNVTEADRIISENYNFVSFGEKLAFLRGMFDFEVVSEHNIEGTSEEDAVKMTYWTVLNCIIDNIKLSWGGFILLIIYTYQWEVCKIKL